MPRCAYANNTNIDPRLLGEMAVLGLRQEMKARKAFNILPYYIEVSLDMRTNAYMSKGLS